MQWHFHKINLFCILALTVILLGGQPAFSQDVSSIRQLPQSKESEKKLVESIVRVEKEQEKAPLWIKPQLAFPREKQPLTDRTYQQANQLTSSPSNYQPFTESEKLKYAFRKAFLRPSPYIFNAVSATVTQLHEVDEPQKDTGDKFADGLTRYAIKFATGSTRTMFVSGIYPAIFHQEPRYQPSGKEGFKARLLYAASRVFVTQSDQGDLQPNISRLGGSLTASALSNIWERNSINHDRIGVGPTLGRFGRMIGFDVLSFVVLHEFGPDIKKKVFKK